MAQESANNLLEDGAGEGPAASRRPRVSRLYVAYILLAAFNVLAISLSLGLHHRLSTIYESTIEENRHWAHRNDMLEGLQMQIAAINAPGNDVFQSGNVAGERVKQAQLIGQFEKMIAETRRDITVHLPVATGQSFLAHLDEVERLTRDMLSQSTLLFKNFERGDLTAAGINMASMDRKYAELIGAVGELESESHKYQSRVLERQSETASRMRLIQFAIAGMIFLMVIGAVIYGHRLWRQTVLQDRERQEQVSALEESEHRFRELAEGSIEGIVVHRDGKPLFVNKAWAEIHGVPDPREVMKEENLSAFVAPEDRAAVQDIQYALQVGAGPSRRYEYRGLRRDGLQPWLECLEQLVTWEGMPALQSTIINITERKKAEDDLRDAIMQAEQATTARTRFFAAASHDLRQPLHAISLYLPLLGKQVEGRKAQEMLGAVQRSAEAMRSLLDSLLDISRLDAGVIEPELGPVSLLEIFDQLGMEFEPQARAKALELRVVVADYWVESDPALLERILRNLLTNAIRYTMHGKILLGARRQGDAVRIEIWDTGIGIPPEVQEHIFEEFYQADNPERDRARGLGLGLAIIDRLTRLLNHQLSMRSQPRKGSVFSVAVPRIAEPVPHGETFSTSLSLISDFAGRLVLLVDDDTAVLEGAEAMFREWGFDVICAEAIGQAVAAANGAGRVPDLILADLRLRGNETGLQAVQEIRKAVGDDIPGIIVTGDTDPDRIRQASASDCALMHKPVEPGKLLAVISRLLKEAENVSEESAQPQSQPAS